ncbi:MAG: response regulator [Pseudomonadales bacterium]|nr:response regulator [Pseudomonadales bacterium]
MAESETPEHVRVLLLDDDAEIRRLVDEYLSQYQIVCRAVATQAELKRAMASEHYDLLLLDIMLPDGDGLSICRDLRQSSTIPVILLTALADEGDRVVGLEMGADDYVTKPFSARELLARIRAVLRRTSAQAWVHTRNERVDLTFDGWLLSVTKRTLHSPEGVNITLTGGEFDLLMALVLQPGRVLTRDQLLEMTKGRTGEAFDRSVDVQLSRLRKKLGNGDLIKTVRGGGYQFSAEVTERKLGAAG